MAKALELSFYLCLFNPFPSISTSFMYTLLTLTFYLTNDFFLISWDGTATSCGWMKIEHQWNTTSGLQPAKDPYEDPGKDGKTQYAKLWALKGRRWSRWRRWNCMQTDKKGGHSRGTVTDRGNPILCMMRWDFFLLEPAILLVYTLFTNIHSSFSP